MALPLLIRTLEVDSRPHMFLLPPVEPTNVRRARKRRTLHGGEHHAAPRHPILETAVGRPRTKHKDLPARVYPKHGALYWVRPGDEKWIRLGPADDKHLCLRELARLEDLKIHITTVSTLLDAYFLRVVPSKAPRTQQDNLNEARYIRAFFGDMPVSLVRSHHVAEYRDAREAKVRANRELALLSHAFTKAIEWGVDGLQINPCANVQKNKEAARTRYVSDAELTAFKTFCTPLQICYIDLKLMTGARKQSLLSLTFSDWDTSSGLRVTMGKTNNTVYFEPESHVMALIARVKALARPETSKVMFCTRAGAHYTATGFDAIWKRRMAKFAKAGFERFHEHDIRGKFATDYEDAGGDAQPALGHKNRKTTDVYVKAKKVITVKSLKPKGA